MKVKLGAEMAGTKEGLLFVCAQPPPKKKFRTVLAQSEGHPWPGKGPEKLLNLFNNVNLILNLFN